MEEGVEVEVEVDVEIKASQTASRQWSSGGCREQTRPDTVLSHHDRSQEQFLNTDYNL